MTQRNRKLIGVVLILVSLVAWGIVATGIYLLFPPNLPWFVLIPYFLVAGVGWVFPAMALIRWMAAPDTAPFSR